MNKILLDYVFPITAIEPVAAASTLFLKQVCVVAKPKSGQEGNVGEVYACDSMTEVAARTDNTNAQQLFNAGMSRVYVLLSDDLDIEAALDAHLSDFFTVLISDDFVDGDLTAGVITAGVASSLKVQDILYTAQETGEAGDDITITYLEDSATGNQAIVAVDGTDITVDIDADATTAATIAAAIEASSAADALVSVEVDDGDETDIQATFTETALAGGVDEVLGASLLATGVFPGVVGISTQSEETATAQAAVSNRVAFISNATNKAKNMFFAFGSLLSNQVNWLNQQYISMPFDDEIEELGDANNYFDDRISFVLSDAEYGERLALFSAGGKAIAAPYIIKNLQIDLQSRALQWIAGNQPQYTKKEAALLETRLQEDVINSYVSRNWISAGTVEISLVSDNFVASGSINVSEPKALWRVFSELRQTL
jgi:hypothetical protein